MTYFKLREDDFANFIYNSKNKIIDDSFELNSEISEFNSKELLPSLVKKIIKKLDILTHDEKILWSKDNCGIFRGIVIENCIFANYKIIIEKWNYKEFQGLTIAKLEDSGINYKISFIKGILVTEKIEYISNLTTDNDEMICLLETIEKKTFQKKN